MAIGFGALSWMLLLLAGSLLGGASPAAAMPAEASHLCGLKLLDGTPVSGLYSETINDPVFANATPSTAVTVQTQQAGSWPQAGPSSGNFSCTASAFSFGPAARAQLDFDGSDLPGAAVRAIASVVVGVRFNSTQAGGPATLPFSILLRDRTDIGLTPNSSVFLNTSARFNMVLDNGQAIGFNHAYGASGISAPGPCTGNACGFLTLLDGMATANTDYTYFISATIAFFGVISAPLTGVSASATVFIDPIISIDPDLEFAAGQKYADYFEVEISPNIVQMIPEPSTASLLLLGLVACCVWRSCSDSADCGKSGV